MQPESILIVDDNTDVAEMWALILRDQGYLTDVAGSGKAGVKKMQSGAYELALIDIRLPDMRGIDLLAQFRQLRPAIECIVVTGHSSEQTAVEAVNQGAYAYLTKPVEEADLLAAVARAFEKQRLREALERAHRTLRTVVDSVDNAILLVGQAGEVLFANRTASDLLGESQQNIRGQDASVLIGRSLVPHAPRAAAAYTALAPGSGTCPADQAEWETMGPQPRVMRRSSTPVEGEDGGMLGRVEVFTDITRERRIAEILQQSILPEIPQRLEGLEIATLYHAALREAEIGGDLYDAFPAGRRKVAVLIGDVSGKGLCAAVEAAMIRYALRGYAFEDSDPARVADRLNRLMWAQAPPDTFTTLFYGVIDLDAGAMLYTNAGHDAPLLACPGEETRCLGLGGPVVGALPDAAYEQGCVRFPPGSTLVLYTDGVTEARRDGQFLDPEGVRRLFERHVAGGSALAVLQGFQADLVEFTRGKFRDDVALLAVRA